MHSYFISIPFITILNNSFLKILLIIFGVQKALLISLLFIVQMLSIVNIYIYIYGYSRIIVINHLDMNHKLVIKI